MNKESYTTPVAGYSGRTNDNRRSITCIQTGQIFTSITEAHEILGIPMSSIANHLRGKEGYELVQRKYSFKYNI